MSFTLHDLGLTTITHRLKSKKGLCFEIGPLLINARSSLAAIASHIIEMYGDYRHVDADYADIHLSVESPRSLHSLLRKQVNFRFDDESPFKPLPFTQAHPFFEWGLNWCIATTAHQYLMIHAAVVAKGGACALIPGRPGAGKSTLCAALVTAGWRLFSDEMALIHMNDGQIWPVPRPISLKNASIDIIRSRSEDIHVGPAIHDTHKGTVAHMRAPRASIEAANIPARAKWIVYPQYQAGANLSSHTVSPCQSALKLADDSFNFPLLGKAGFDLLADTAFSCDSFEFGYSDLDEAIAWFDQLSEFRGSE